MSHNAVMSTYFSLCIQCIFLAIFSTFIASGCYRMPEEGEVSVVPITNNPAVTRQQQGNPLIPPGFIPQ